MVSVPIYRAKKIDSDEYIHGNIRKIYLRYDKPFYAIETEDVEYDDFGRSDYEYFEIDKSTLAITFDSKTWYELEDFIDTIDANIDLFKETT